ncbi:F-actin-uncapping protein LRRC16A-like isoform X3 [Littorina saxatilis]|uniref:F-actin-uncapping protein LRRC16A n=1 Tax=Littorina saxatilis TaxID=31220 RepID=A0AAN9GML2_9CAEN
MAAASNIPRDIQDAVREVLDRRIKISIKCMVKHEVRSDKTENRVLAFSPCRLFVLAAKSPSKVEHSFHFLDIQALESKKVNQLLLTVEGKVYTFTSLEASTEEVNHMITHIGISLKQIFPAFPLERLIVKVEVIPPERLRTMHDMIRGMERKEGGPCGGYTTQYACMCDYHGLPYREEVAWDVDTIYLSQDSRKLSLRDFDHLSAKDFVPIIGALEHNTWFTTLDVSNVKLLPEACSEILKVMKRNAIIEHLNLANTGMKTDFLQKLSIALLSNSGTQLSSLDISGNLIEDRGVTHLMGTLKSLSRGFHHLDISRTAITSRCLSKAADTISQSQSLLSSLQTLKVAECGQKGEDISGLYLLLAQPNVLTTLDLSATDCAMDSLVSPLLLGCPHLATLLLSRTTFTHKRTKDTVVPVAWKQFFASTCSLQRLDVSSTRLPPDAVKELLLGIASNRHLKNLDLDLSSNELGSQGAQVISSCISNIPCLGRLDVSNNGFDADLKALVPEIAKNKHLKHLAVGRNFGSIKPKHMWSVLETIVQLLQEENTMLESLSLADSKLKNDTACIINALGSNNSLMNIDLSGNSMGDFGARMLSKALQINTKLHTVVWDKNSVTAQGFEDIADALEKNYTLKRMPFPVNDAALAMRTQAERTETALQKVELLLQRNHSPHKFASDQQYRLQQGFLISSTQQMVDRLCVQVQDAVNALKVSNTGASEEDLEHAEKVIKDADNSKQLLPKLQGIAMRTQDSGNELEKTLQNMADKLRSVMEETMQKSVDDMLKCTSQHCEGVMTDKEFRSEVETGCKPRSSLPKDFTKFVLDSVATDVFNKISELNLAVAAHISDSVIDEVISKLSDSHKGLGNHLNLRKSSSHIRDSTAVQLEKVDTESEKEKDEVDAVEARTRQPSGGSPKLSSKKKSVFSRKLRPQSVIDRDLLAPKVQGTSDSVRDHSPEKEEVVAADRVAMTEDKADELEGAETKSTTSLDKISESRSKDSTPKGSRDALNTLPDIQPVQPTRLEHLNKTRPKRPKTRAATRPVAPVEEAADDGINTFYAATPTSPEPTEKTKVSSNRRPSTDDTISSKPEKKKWSPMNPFKSDKKDDKEKKEKGFSSGISNFFRHKTSKSDAKDKEKKPETFMREKPVDAPIPQRTETSKIYTRSEKSPRMSRPESPKSPRPDSALSSTPPLVLVDPKVVPQRTKLMAPHASEESLDDEDSLKVKDKAPSVELTRSDSGREDERSRSSRSSTSEKEEKEEAEEAGASAEEEKEEQEDQVGEPTPPPRQPKGPPRMGMGFGANIMADLKSQKRFSARLPSPEEPKDAPKESASPVKKPEKATAESKKEETNNNVVSNNKEEQVKPAAKLPEASVTKPAEPVVTKPAEPAATLPADPVITKPAELVVTKPEQPVHTKPAEASAAPKRTEANGAKPALPSAAKPTEANGAKPALPSAAKPTEAGPMRTALLPPTKANSSESGSSPRPAPRALLPPRKPVQVPVDTAPAASAGGGGGNGDSAKPASESASSAPSHKPRPAPPAKPKPPVTAPKPRPSIKKESPPDENSSTGAGEGDSTGERKSAEGEIVYDSSTLRMSVKDKIKRLSQVKFEPPSAAAPQKKTTSLPRDAKLPDSLSGTS